MKLEVEKLWPGVGEIACITFSDIDGEGSYCVGQHGTTRIEKAGKEGPHSYLPYVRVFKGEHVVAEFCQHMLNGVYFKSTP